jgi:hypothetical protein
MRRAGAAEPHGNSEAVAGRRRFRLGGAATTTFSASPAEDMAIVIMGQVMSNDGDLPQNVETLVYKALIDIP